MIPLPIWGGGWGERVTNPSIRMSPRPGPPPGGAARGIERGVLMFTKRDLFRSAALAAIATACTKSGLVLAEDRAGLLAARNIAEAGFIYGLPIVMNYGVMYEF